VDEGQSELPERGMRVATTSESSGIQAESISPPVENGCGNKFDILQISAAQGDKKGIKDG